MDIRVVLAVFPIIFIGELPDKTMFASLVLASRGRPRSVWLGAAGAFLVHVLIAVTIGVALFRLLPQRAVEALVAVLFGAGAVFAFWEARGHEDEAALVNREVASHSQIAVTAFAVIFIAEWGDLTQILTANLAAHYQNGLSVATGAILALWTVAALAVTTGTGLLRYVSIRTVRLLTGIALTGLAVYSAVAAIRG
jgi:putative Ca2+/H+ antiporter (TMEM165/GDT1 family)